MSLSQSSNNTYSICSFHNKSYTSLFFLWWNLSHLDYEFLEDFLNPKIAPRIILHVWEALKKHGMSVSFWIVCPLITNCKKKVNLRFFKVPNDWVVREGWQNGLTLNQEHKPLFILHMWVLPKIRQNIISAKSTIKIWKLMNHWLLMI